MIKVDIPGFGNIEIQHLVSDFTGTLSENGLLCTGVKDRLNQLSKALTIHILTADTYGRAQEELKGIHCIIHILEGANHDMQKMEYVKSLGAEGVVALGNGNNDREMLKAAKVGIAVCLKEGCSFDALRSGDIMVTSISDALDLLLNTTALKATLRF